MIEITELKTYGWEEAIRGMRNSYNSWDKSDSEFDMSGQGVPVIGPNDLTLMKKLCAAGSDHCKFRRMITVSMDINAPLYFWKEFDTYKVGTVANSCSTMHKIAEKEFIMDDFSHEHLASGWPTQDSNGNTVFVSGPYESLQKTIDLLNNIRKMYLYVSNTPKSQIDYTHTPALTEKEIWWQMIQLLPSSYNQKRTVTMNYEVLANIYKSRKNHKLDEWQTFCKMMESTLPYPELFITRK
mgnify:FL=1|nr:MAG TPA: hypothetical protein [Caudoviricetes sp.]